MLARCQFERRILLSLGHISQRLILILLLLIMLLSRNSSQLLLSLVHLVSWVALVLNVLLASLPLTLSGSKSITHTRCNWSLLDLEFWSCYFFVSLHLPVFFLLISLFNNRPGFNLRRLNTSGRLIMHEVILKARRLLAHFRTGNIYQFALVAFECLYLSFLLGLGGFGFFLFVGRLKFLVVVGIFFSFIVVRYHVAHFKFI